jgi:hypothetical protein
MGFAGKLVRVVWLLQSRGITLAAVGVILLLWFTPAQMHFDPELDGPLPGHIVGDSTQLSGETRRLLSLDRQLDLQGTNGDVDGDRLVAPDGIEDEPQPNVVDESGNMKHKLKRLSSEMIRHAHRMKSTLDAEDATSVVSLAEVMLTRLVWMYLACHVFPCILSLWVACG